MILKSSEVHNVLSLNHKFILKNFNGHGRYIFGWMTSKITSYNKHKFLLIHFGLKRCFNW